MSTFISSLYIMLYGMLGIFAVIAFLAVFVLLLAKVFPVKK